MVRIWCVVPCHSAPWCCRHYASCRSDSARKILAFAKAGGRVYALGELPTASVDRGLGDPEMAAVMRELAQTRDSPVARMNRRDAVHRGHTDGWQFQ